MSQRRAMTGLRSSCMYSAHVRGSQCHACMHAAEHSTVDVAADKPLGNGKRNVAAAREQQHRQDVVEPLHA